MFVTDRLEHKINKTNLNYGQLKLSVNTLNAGELAHDATMENVRIAILFRHLQPSCCHRG